MFRRRTSSSVKAKEVLPLLAKREKESSNDDDNKATKKKKNNKKRAQQHPHPRVSMTSHSSSFSSSSPPSLIISVVLVVVCLFVLFGFMTRNFVTRFNELRKNNFMPHGDLQYKTQSFGVDASIKNKHGCELLVTKEAASVAHAVTAVPLNKPVKCPTLSNNDDDNNDNLKIAMLISFPNSGTTYTLHIAQKSSQKFMGSNYVRESSAIPVFHDQPYGPFWMYGDFDWDLPTKYLLTKSHCSGFCPFCAPSEYILPNTKKNNQEEAEVEQEEDSVFTKSCFKHSNERDRVEKVLHIIRHPLSNIVARYHLGVNRIPFLKNYIKNRTGFRFYCKASNFYFGKKEKQFILHNQFSSSLDDDKLLNKNNQFSDLSDSKRQQLWELLKDVPCRSDFIKYVQWHNSAIQITSTTTTSIQETMILHYEDYVNEQTAYDVFDFLETDIVEPIPSFYEGKNYFDYYTDTERLNVREALKILASDDTWEQLERYQF